MNLRSQGTSTGIPLWRDARFIRVFGQVVLLVVLLGVVGYLMGNMLSGLKQQGLALGYSFLRLTAGFDISEHLVPYDRTSTYLQALQVGLLNTALVSVLGVILSTILGIIFGVASLSPNVLLRWMARAYIEFLRNIPLLVLLIFWYTGVFLKMPRVGQAAVLPGNVLVSNRGIAVPWGIPTETFSAYLIILGTGILLAAVVGVTLLFLGRRTGRTPLIWLWSSLTFLAVALVGWYLLPTPALQIDLPAREGLRIAGGRQLTPEFMALLSGLAIYTSAFTADIVRAGIQSVSRGQVEAAKAIGLNGFQILRLVVFPQAMRVIIPPLTNQFLNLTKNSSLAVAIGYPDLFSVSGTILNQSGRAVEVIALVMALYLGLSLLTSLLMNWYNRRVRLVER